MKKNLFISAVALFLIFFGTALYAQEDKGVLLEFKSAPADGAGYTLAVYSDSFFTLYGLEKKIRQSVTTDFTMTPAEVVPPVKDALGFAIEINDEKVVSDGEKIDSPARGTKLNLKISKNGKIIGSSDPSKLQYFQDLIISFPEKPVKKGEEWKVETPFKIQNGDGSEKELTAILKCKIEDFKNINGRNCAVIETKLSVADEKTGSASLKAGAAGTMNFDYEAGKIISINNVINMDVKVYNEKAQTKKPLEASTLKSKISVKLNLKK